MNSARQKLLGITLALVMLVGSIPLSFADQYVSPRVQLKSGVAVEDIQCRDDRVLVLRTNGSPACLKQSTAEKQGWEILNQNNHVNTDMSIILPPEMKTGSISIEGEPNQYHGTVFLEMSELPELGKTITITATATNPYDYDMTLDHDQKMGLVIVGNNIEFVGEALELSTTKIQNQEIAGSTAQSYIHEPFVAKTNQIQIIEAQVNVIGTGIVGFTVFGVDGDILQESFYVDGNRTITYDEYYQENKEKLDREFYAKTQESIDQQLSFTTPAPVDNNNAESTMEIIAVGSEANAIAEQDEVYDEELSAELEEQILYLLQRIEENKLLIQSYDSEITKLTKELNATTDDETRGDLEEEISDETKELEEIKSAIASDKFKITDLETQIDELKKTKN